MQLEKLLNETIKSNLDNGNEIAYIAEQIKKINERIDSITNEGYSFVEMENITLRSRANYIGSHGHFAPSELDNYEGKEYNILVFENDKNEKRYCIVNDDLDIVKMPLSKLKYYDREIEENENYKLYIETKETILPALKKLGIEITPQEAFLVFSESDLSNSENIAKSFVNEVKNAVLTLTEKEVEISEYSYSHPAGIIDVNYDFSHEMLACGMERQSYATYSLSENLNDYRNSAEMNYIAIFLYKQMQKMAIEMYQNGEFNPTINVAEKLGIKDIILEDIINRKDEEAFKNFLRIEIFEKDENGNISKNYKPFPKALEKALVKELKKEPCELNVSYIHSNMKDSLTLIRRLNPELQDNTLAAQAVVEFSKITGPYAIENVVAQPTFIEEFKNGKNPNEFLADIRNGEFCTELYTAPMAFNRLNLIKIGITDEKILLKLSDLMLDRETRNRFKTKNKEELETIAQILSDKELTITRYEMLNMMDENIPSDIIATVGKMSGFNYSQKVEIALGLKNGINVELYQDSSISSEKMEEVRLALEAGKQTKTEKIIESIDTKELSRLISGFNSSLKQDCGAYGGHGPGDFDNRGGYQEIKLFGKSIIHEELISTFDGGSERDAILWAHNYSTKFDFDKLDEQIKFCEAHKLAITIAILGDMVSEEQSFYDLKEQISLIEKTLEEKYNIDLENLDIEKYCELLKDGCSISVASDMLKGGTISNLIESNTIETPIDNTRTTISQDQAL